jgi:hypothetical protein
VDTSRGNGDHSQSGELGAFDHTHQYTKVKEDLFGEMLDPRRDLAGGPGKMPGSPHAA